MAIIAFAICSTRISVAQQRDSDRPGASEDDRGAFVGHGGGMIGASRCQRSGNHSAGAAASGADHAAASRAKTALPGSRQLEKYPVLDLGHRDRSEGSAIAGRTSMVRENEDMAAGDENTLIGTKMRATERNRIPGSLEGFVHDGWVGRRRFVPQWAVVEHDVGSLKRDGISGNANHASHQARCTVRCVSYDNNVAATDVAQRPL